MLHRNPIVIAEPSKVHTLNKKTLASILETGNITNSNLIRQKLFNSNKQISQSYLLHTQKTMMNIKKNMILFHEPDVFKMFNNAYTEDDYKKLFIKHSRILFAIDFIIVLLNSTVVLGLYFDTEKFNENDYKLDSLNNKIRSANLVLSFIVVLLLVFRYLLKVKIQYFRYVLGIRLSCM